jgi:hypothetical protein
MVTGALLCYSHANDNLALKDRELKSLRRQVDSGQEDLSEASRGRDIAMQENRRLQDDLAVMARENQVPALFLLHRQKLIVLNGGWVLYSVPISTRGL